MSVYKAISNVMKRLSKNGIGKNGVNSHQKYNYRSIDDMYNSLSSIMSEECLIILPNIKSHKAERISTAKGIQSYTVIEVEYTFIYSEDGSTCKMVVYGEALDTSDKSTNKAMSAAYKYACIQAFCIPIDGNDDADKETLTFANDVLSEEIETLIEETGSDIGQFLAYFKVGSISEMSVSMKNKAIGILDNKKRKNSSNNQALNLEGKAA